MTSSWRSKCEPWVRQATHPQQFSISECTQTDSRWNYQTRNYFFLTMIWLIRKACVVQCHLIFFFVTVPWRDIVVQCHLISFDVANKCKFMFNSLGMRQNSRHQMFKTTLSPVITTLIYHSVLERWSLARLCYKTLFIVHYENFTLMIIDTYVVSILYFGLLPSSL